MPDMNINGGVELGGVAGPHQETPVVTPTPEPIATEPMQPAESVSPAVEPATLAPEAEPAFSPPIPEAVPASVPTPEVVHEGPAVDTPTAAASEVTPEVPQPMTIPVTMQEPVDHPVEVKKPGFFARWFGGGKTKEAEAAIAPTLAAGSGGAMAVEAKLNGERAESSPEAPQS